MEPPHAPGLGCFGSALALPRLDLVPTGFTLGNASESERTMATALVHAGLLLDRHLDATPNLRKAMDLAIHEWLEPWHRRLKLFAGVSFAYTDHLEPNMGEKEWLTEEKPAAFMVITDHDDPLWPCIGGCATSLEKIWPGLGSALITLIAQAGTAGIGVFTPIDTLSEAQYHFWHGEANEHVKCEEYRSEVEGRDGAPATDAEVCAELNIPTRAEFDAILPPWATRVSSRIWYPGKIDTFPEAAPPGVRGVRRHFGKIMAAANALAAQLRTVRRRWMKPRPKGSPHHCHFEDSPNHTRLLACVSVMATQVFLRWDGKDQLTGRVVDDIYEMISQTGEGDKDLTACSCFDPLDPADCVRARRRFEDLLETSVLTDQLLQLTVTNE